MCLERLLDRNASTLFITSRGKYQFDWTLCCVYRKQLFNALVPNDLYLCCLRSVCFLVCVFCLLKVCSNIQMLLWNVHCCLLLPRCGNVLNKSCVGVFARVVSCGFAGGNVFRDVSWLFGSATIGRVPWNVGLGSCFVVRFCGFCVLGTWPILYRNFVISSVVNWRAENATNTAQICFNIIWKQYTQLSQITTLCL